MASYSPDVPGRGATGTGRRLAAAVVALFAALLLIAVVTMVARSNQERDAALLSEQHSYDIMVLTASLDGSMARAEAALGHYVINSDRRTGTIFKDEWTRAEGQLRRLAELTADQPDQTKLVRRLTALFADRRKEVAAAASFANVGKGWYAIGMFNRVGESPNVRAIGQTLEQITANERARLGTRSAATIFSVERSNSFATLLSVLGLALVGLAILLGWMAAASAAQHRNASDLAQAETERATMLEAAVAERTSELSTANDQLRAEAETRRRTEAQLAQSQKMEAVGLLTGGIAHDFNNMLAVIVSGLDLARRRLRQGIVDVEGHLDSAMEGADRAASLTRRLLSFARSEPLLPDLVSAGELVRGMSDLLDRTLGERITVHVAVDGKIWPIWADAHQLENAILNLAVNARDAMDGAGRIDIAVSNARIRAGDAGALAPGDYVRIRVTDDGCGMPPEVQARAFEPFFTTKPVGKGTGLGLSQIFGLVRQSGGDVRIDSTVGEGTTISLFLPRDRSHAGVTSRSTDAGPVAEAGTGIALSIVLVEDDPRVHASMLAALAELGHRAIGCTQGEEAIALLATGISVDLLLTDVMMAGITGPELAARVHELHPDIAILFITGYVGEAGTADQFVGHDVLRKPFTIAALHGAIEKTIQRRPVSPSRAA
ncbi:MAG: histidine kinase [Rhizorhabdus sp.]|nr:histidine kinase [Rhizorhabdus sp.]